jgi:hypothetical protein
LYVTETRIGHRSAVSGHGHADLGGCTVAVVGEALDEQCHSAVGIAFVHDRLVVDSGAVEAASALDRTGDVVGGNRVLLRLLDRVEERRIAVGVRSTVASGNLDVLDQLGEELAALGIDGRLLVFSRCPFGMTCHWCSFL